MSRVPLPGLLAAPVRCRNTVPLLVGAEHLCADGGGGRVSVSQIMTNSEGGLLSYKADLM